MNNSEQSIYILGAGSIGLLWACRLAEQGSSPILIQREANKSLLITRTEKSNVKNFQFDAVSIKDDFSVSFLLITTKAHQTQAAILSIQQKIKPDACLILLQNGMGNGEWLAAQFPSARIFLGTTTDGVFRTNKTHFTVAGSGETYFGPLSTMASIDAIQILLSATTTAHWDHQIQTRLWQKLAVNCIINPLTALYECKNGELIANPLYFSHFKQIAIETERAFISIGISTPAPSLLEFAMLIAEKTAANINSMLADKRAGKGTEIEFILGYLLNKVNASEFPQLQNLYYKIKNLTKPL